MLELPALTLVCIDCQQPALALAAIEQSMIRCRFGGVVHVTDREVSIDGIEVVRVDGLADPAARSRFIANDLAGHVKTSHVLFIGWDAFPVNPDGWTDAFLDHDFVMARRKPGVAPPSSTGIVLVSRATLERMRDAGLPEGADPLALLQADDPSLKSIAPLRPPVGIAEKFAFGDYAPVGSPFGFERSFNMWMFFQPADLSTFIAMAPPPVLASPDALSLAINLHALSRIAEATALMAAIARARPGDDVVRGVIDAVGGRLPVVTASMGAAPAVGRNDPCPCGSGRRYKQCHGALGATARPSVVSAAAIPAAIPSGSAPARATDGASGTVPAAVATDAPPALSNLPRADGAAAVWMHRAREAFRLNEPTSAALHRHVLEAEPDNAEAASYLGVIAMRERHFAQAETWLTRAVEMAPHSAEFRINLGMYRQMRGEDAAALTAYADAIRLEPANPAAHNNLGLLLQETGSHDAAIAAFRKAIAAAPAFADAHWNLALALLAMGEYEEGLAEHEWRFKAASQREAWGKRNHFPTWKGEPLHGKRILVLAEQGLGDILQYIRYAVALAERGASVVVETPPELTALMRTTRGVSLVAPRGGPFPACDWQVPVMSLPYLFATRVDSIPAPVPYVLPDVARSARWKAILGEKTKPRIGVNWSGNPLQVRNKTRSLPLAMLAPLLRRGDIEFLSLHKGLAADEISSLPADIALRDLMPKVDDFADTAALMMELDLLITTDTGVAHLAGALGVPTLVLLDASPDFRWLLGRNDSPWYPTMRLIRQSTRGEWQPVVDEAMREVGQRFGTPPAA